MDCEYLRLGADRPNPEDKGDGLSDRYAISSKETECARAR